MSRARHERAWSMCVVIGLGALLSSCEDPNALPDLAGRFVGSWMNASGTRVPLVAQVPAFQREGQTIRLKVDAYAISPTSQAQTIQILVLEKTRIEVDAPSFQVSKIELARTQGSACAEGTAGAQKTKLCWSGEKIELFNRIDAQETSVLLQRSEGMPSSTEQRPYGLEEVLGRAKLLSYSVAQEGERVFQARQAIRVARGNLLPSLNYQAVVGILTGDFVDAVGKLLPFIFPGNWYRWKAQGFLYEAEKKSFASLRGNEMISAEALYYIVHRDQAVLQTLSAQRAWTERVLASLRREETVGALPQGTADFYSTSVARLQSDEIALSSLVRDELAQIAQVMALDPVAGVTALEPLPAADLSTVADMDGTALATQAVTQSFELAALGDLLEAARLGTKETEFSFLDPDGPGLGFGWAASLPIGPSRQRELAAKADEVRSLVQLRSAQVSTSHNSALKAFRVSSNGLRETEKRIRWLMERHLQGDPTLGHVEFIELLISLQEQWIGFGSDVVSATMSWRISVAQAQRLLRSGAYSQLESGLPLSEKRLP